MNTHTITILSVILLFSCNTDYPNRKNIEEDNEYNRSAPNFEYFSDTIVDDPTYLFTGIYSLSDNESGVHMDLENTDAQFLLNPQPLVSVKNILRAEMFKQYIESRSLVGITIILDNQGAKDLEEKTGNLFTPYIGLIIANRLIYVAERQGGSITSGVLNIILEDYPEDEIEEMVQAINDKK